MQYLELPIMPISTYILLVLTMLFWGGTFIAGRLLSGDISVYSAAFLRFFIASIVLFCLLKLANEKTHIPSRSEFLGLFFLGATGVFSYNVFFFTGLHYINAGRAALIIASTPLIITLFALLFFREPLSPIKIIGILLSMTGAMFVISNGHPSAIFTGGFGRGELSLLGCVFSWSAYTLIGKKMLSSMSPLSSVFFSSIIGTVLLFLPAMTTGLFQEISELTHNNWLQLSYLGIFGTALGFSWYYGAIKKIGATQAGVFINLVPVFAIILSWLILDEAMKPSVLIGGAMILSGVSLTNFAGIRKVNTL